MSIPSILDVLAYIKSHGELTKGERLTLIAIANYADHADAQAYPSLKKLQEFTALTRRGQQMVLRRLENSKVIETRRNPRLRSSTYRLCIPRNDSSKSRRELTSQVLNAPANSLRGGGELTSPQPVIDLEERKDAREIYRSRARDDRLPLTRNHEELAAQARKVGILPGSPIFGRMVALPEDQESFHGSPKFTRELSEGVMPAIPATENTKEGFRGGDPSPVLPHAQGQDHRPANHGEGHIKWVDPEMGRGQSGFLLVSPDGHWHAVITKRSPYRLLYVWQAAS